MTSHRSEEPVATAVSVVMITRNRQREAIDAVERLLALPEAPPIIVVDNGSTDNTVAAISRRFGARVTVVPLGRNAGAAGRNSGVRLATTRYVAFADDDSGWAPGALERAVAVLDDHPQMALVAAHVLLGTAEVPDPACEAMAASPLARRDDLPGPAVLGFIACAAVVRRSAFLAAGGFDECYGVGGEESPLAIELATRGWQLSYVDTVTALHWPSPVRDRRARRRTVIRNDLWITWRRRHWSTAVRRTVRYARLGITDGTARAAMWDAIREGRAVLADRRHVDRHLEEQLRLLDAASR